jgi:elongation factor P--(R)-beta-lysine ligase
MAPVDWRPAASPATARRRAAMLAQARRFFEERGILEVDTPVLSKAPVSDPHIESVPTEPGPARPRRYLQTSPEYPMKRLLCAGWPDIYEICKVFRDGEAGSRHQPEFTLVEWYRRGFGLAEMRQETAAFLSALIEPRILAAPPEYLDYGAAFERHAGVDPRRAGVDALTAAAGADPDLARALGDDRDAWLDLLLTQRVAPAFARDRLTVLYHYPASQAALARICPADPAVADRFEVFLGDLELANGFVELRDAGEQLRRFEAELEKRRRKGQPVGPLDRCFIAALESGLPECAGVAVGFDRLLMINEMTDDIRHVQTFPEDRHP